MAANKQKNEHTVTGKIRFEEMPKIRLLTNSGLFLWNGRPGENGKKYIMGFQTFIKKLKSIEIASRADDPYADRHMVKIENWMNEAQEKLDSLNADLQTIMDSHHSRLVIPPSVVAHEVEVPVHEHAKLVWIALEILLNCDDAVKRVLDASHTARISIEEKRSFLREAEGICRHMMRSAYDYKFTGVTRRDIVQNNMKAKEAFDAMGEIEREYLEAVTRSKYAPPIDPEIVKSRSLKAQEFEHAQHEAVQNDEESNAVAKESAA